MATYSPGSGYDINPYMDQGHTWSSPDNSTGATLVTDIAGYSSEDAGGQTFSDIMGIWVTGIVCILGMAGNILSFIVLTQAFGRSPMFYVLRAVAVSDALFLFSVFLIQTMVNMYPYTGLVEWCYRHRGYIQYFTWPLLMTTQMSTVWLTALVSVERYIAICYPLRAACYCTLSKMRRAVIAVFLFSAVYNIPRFFEFRVLVSENTIDKTAVGTHLAYRYLYSCILYSLVLFFVPLAILIVLNAKLLLALESGRKQWQRLSCNQKREQVITVIPLAIVIMFFICGTPALIVNIVDSMYPEIYGAYPQFITFIVVANLLVVLNSACNFIIYCLLGRKFRRRLMELCSCHCRAKYSVVHHLISTQFTEPIEGTTEI